MIGEYYHGIAVFRRERDKYNWPWDWADLDPKVRERWGERQDYELAGKTWKYGSTLDFDADE